MRDPPRNIAEDPTRRAALIALFVGNPRDRGRIRRRIHARRNATLGTVAPRSRNSRCARRDHDPRRGPRTPRESDRSRFHSRSLSPVLAIGFCAALALPATEGPLSRLWLGLPARAAMVIYGIGLLPIVVLPIAYALTFETQTLSAEDVERVRALARANKSAIENARDREPARRNDHSSYAQRSCSRSRCRARRGQR